MGKPSASCLKIIACGSDSAVEDEVEAPEAKGSGEKRGWRFRKRSARHRVLSNSVTSENLTTTTQSQTPVAPAIPEKVVVLEQHEEKHQPPVELKPPKPIKTEQAEAFDAPEPPVSVEPEVSETLNAPKPPGSFEPEASERSDAPKQPASFEPEVPEASDAAKPPGSFESEVPETSDAPKPPGSFEPEAPETSVAPKPPRSFELEVPETSDAHKPSGSFEPEVPETLDAPKPPEVSETVDTSESPELVEEKTYFSAAASEPFNFVEPEVSARMVSAPEPPATVESKIPEGVVASESPVSTEMELSETVVALQDDILEETIVIDMQTGVRGFLAKRELEKLRSAIKLQAAIRGHLVRRHAVDTLYCMQGIVKVQSLVRARHSKLLGDEASVTKPITMQSSTEKLLRNGFSRQLLESTPKSKSTVTKCDPLKPNSAWAWLERWMAVSSPGPVDLETPYIRVEDGHSQAEKTSPIMECETLSEVKSESANPEFDVEEASKIFENQKSSISYDPKEEFQPSNILSNEGKMEQPYDDTVASFQEQLGMAGLENQSIQSDSHSQTQSGSPSDNLVVKTEEPRFSVKRMASEQVDVESKKFAYGSRKASNPAFVTAQSKFEELSSAANNGVSLKSPPQDASAEYHTDTASSLEENVAKGKEPSSEEALLPDETRANMGGSECGTELSVTSTLDSPDHSEAEVAGMDPEVKHLEEKASNHIINESLEVKANGLSSVYASNSSSSAFVQEEFHESNGVSNPLVAEDSHQPEHMPKAMVSDEQDNAHYVDLNMASDSPQVLQKPERSSSDLQAEAGSLTEPEPVYKSSPVTSPNNSHNTIAESQGTPSSQVSVKPKRSKADKSGSNVKRSSLSAGNKTPAKPLHDSGSGEQLSKDQKSGKRRNSFGSAKSDNVDQEPRDSTSSTKAVPGYMQATESAKAKAHSPRSSPDVQDKDTYTVKKRHSLPDAGGRQGSPRVQRSTSQATQTQPGKGNANTPPQERRWLR